MGIVKLTKKEKRKLKRKNKIFRTVKFNKQKTISDSFLASYEWRSLRMKALIRDGRKCACCGATPNEGAIMHVDHIKPRSSHPELSLDINNLQVLCEECNHGKGSWDTTDWRKKNLEIVGVEKETMNHLLSILSES